MDFLWIFFHMKEKTIFKRDRINDSTDVLFSFCIKKHLIYMTDLLLLSYKR